MSQEQDILVIPTVEFRGRGYFNGFSSALNNYAALLQGVPQFMPRPVAEEDPNFKQLIPYVVGYRVRDDGTKEFGSYVRGKGQGEKRLHALWSIGFGGHVHRSDFEGCNVVAGGLHVACHRELQEELTLATDNFDCAWQGLINVDSNDVGKVHLGLLYLANLTDICEGAKEAEIEDFVWRTPADLQENYARYETWSQVVIEALPMLLGFGKVASVQVSTEGEMRKVKMP